MPIPKWLRKDLPTSGTLATAQVLDDQQLHTVCESAKCPNRMECWSKGTATFMILGEVCTRACRFCSIAAGKPTEIELDEPMRVAEAAKKMNLDHVVITSVARDDLVDGGSGHFVKTIACVREMLPKATVEVLTPDFGGSWDQINYVCQARPDVFNHNIETVRRLTPSVRSRSDYHRSLKVLEEVKKNYSSILTKSAIMLGVGETQEEVCQTIEDLHRVHCDILLIGQYMQPEAGAMPVQQYYELKRFDFFAEYAKKLGFLSVVAKPFVRSSYLASEVFKATQQRLSSNQAKAGTSTAFLSEATL